MTDTEHRLSSDAQRLTVAPTDGLYLVLRRIIYQREQECARIVAEIRPIADQTFADRVAAGLSADAAAKAAAAVYLQHERLSQAIAELNQWRAAGKRFHAMSVRHLVGQIPAAMRPVASSGPAPD